MNDDELDTRLRTALREAVSDWHPEPPGVVFSRRRRRHLEVAGIAAAVVLVAGVAIGIGVSRTSTPVTTAAGTVHHPAGQTGAVAGPAENGLQAQGAEEPVTGCGAALVGGGTAYLCVGSVHSAELGLAGPVEATPSSTPSTSEEPLSVTPGSSYAVGQSPASEGVPTTSGAGAATSPGNPSQMQGTGSGSTAGTTARTTISVTVGQEIVLRTPSASSGDTWGVLTLSPATDFTTLSTEPGTAGGTASAIFRAVAAGTTTATATELPTCDLQRCGGPIATWSVTVVTVQK